MDKTDDKRLYIYLSVIIALAIPALLINLGLQTFINDESIRALVALEIGYLISLKYGRLTLYIV